MNGRTMTNIQDRLLESKMTEIEQARSGAAMICPSIVSILWRSLATAR